MLEQTNRLSVRLGRTFSQTSFFAVRDQCQLLAYQDSNPYHFNSYESNSFKLTRIRCLDKVSSLTSYGTFRTKFFHILVKTFGDLKQQAQLVASLNQQKFHAKPLRFGKPINFSGGV